MAFMTINPKLEAKQAKKAKPLSLSATTKSTNFPV